MFKVGIFTVWKMSCLAVLILLMPLGMASQDWLRTGINQGVEKPRLAVPDFKAATNDPQTSPLNMVFSQTLWSDLDNSGILEMVSKSFYPLSTPGLPSELRADAW